MNLTPQEPKSTNLPSPGPTMRGPWDASNRFIRLSPSESPRALSTDDRVKQLWRWFRVCVGKLGRNAFYNPIEHDAVVVSGLKMTSRGHRQLAIVAEQAAEAGAALDLATSNLDAIAAGCRRS